MDKNQKKDKEGNLNQRTNSLNLKNKKTDSFKDSVSEYERLKKEFKDLETEEKQLKDYLNINVFDYAQNKQQIEDIFSVSNVSLAFLEKDKENKVINPNIPVVEVNNLTKYYASRKTPSLVNVTMKLYLGDIHVVVGSGGSGKTTLFDCLRGVEGYEGEILIDGKEIQNNENFVADEIISFISSSFGWDLYSTVEEVMSDRCQELNLTDIETQNYIRSSLEQLNISYLKHYPVIDLTLLEKRKIQIAIALINDPHVIVLDEISLGLQQHEIFDLLEIFDALKKEERAILLFSHSFDEFTKFANTVTVLSDGEVYYTGLVEGLFVDKLNQYSIVTSDNIIAQKILVSMGCKFTYKDMIDTIYVEFDGHLKIFDFQKKCIEYGIFVREQKALETKLEDLFHVLRKTGNKDAIKTINTASFFSP